MTRTRSVARGFAFALVASAALASAPAFAAHEHTTPLVPVNGAHVSGNVSFSPDGANAIVFVVLAHAPGYPQAAAVIRGACPANAAAVEWGLSPITAGVSQTTIKAGLHTVLDGAYSVVVRASTSKGAPVIACAALAPLPQKSPH